MRIRRKCHQPGDGFDVRGRLWLVAMVDQWLVRGLSVRQRYICSLIWISGSHLQVQTRCVFEMHVNKRAKKQREKEIRQTSEVRQVSEMRDRRGDASETSQEEMTTPHTIVKKRNRTEESEE